MPCLGLGLYQTPPGPLSFNTVKMAIEVGYRHFDTATLYQNEKDIGETLQSCGRPREEFFITTKLWNADHGYKETLKAFQRSLKLLQLEWVDLYLIHWPVPGKRLDSWRAIEELYRQGLCKAIGVSNFTQAHLQEILTHSHIPPMVNQVEFSPFLYQKELLEFCQKQNIQLQAYSPLTKGKRLHHPTLLHLSEKYLKSPAQILLRWCLEMKVVPLVKTIHQHRLQENITLFDFTLEENDQKLLSQLHEDYRTSWDPTWVK